MFKWIVMTIWSVFQVLERALKVLFAVIGIIYCVPLVGNLILQYLLVLLALYYTLVHYLDMFRSIDLDIKKEERNNE